MAAPLLLCLLALFCVGATALAIRLVLGKPLDYADESEKEKRWWRAIK